MWQKKLMLPNKCSHCISDLLLSTEGRLLNASVQHKDDGGLLYPSLQLFCFITHLETVFTSCFSAHKLHRKRVTNVLQIIHGALTLKAVGCGRRNCHVQSAVVPLPLLVHSGGDNTAIPCRSLSRPGWKARGDFPCDASPSSCTIDWEDSRPSIGLHQA